jgi:hypothetical protein
VGVPAATPRARTSRRVVAMPLPGRTAGREVKVNAERACTGGGWRTSVSVTSLFLAGRHGQGVLCQRKLHGVRSCQAPVKPLRERQGWISCDPVERAIGPYGWSPYGPKGGRAVTRTVTAWRDPAPAARSTPAPGRRARERP